MKQIFFVIITVLVVASCSQEGVENRVAQEVSLENQVVDLSLEIDTVEIDVDDFGLPYYQVFSLNNAEKNEFFGYNASRHSIDIFNLVDKKHIKSIPLFKEGPDGVSEVKAMKVLNDGSIYLFGRNEICNLNSEGQVINKQRIQSGHKFYSEYNLYPHHSTSLAYEESSDALITGSVNIKVSSYSQPEKFYKRSNIVAQVSQDKNEIESIPLPYPKAYSEKYFGFLDAPYISVQDGKIYASFPAVSDISCYDLEKEELSILKVNPKLTKAEATSLDWSDSKHQDKKMAHFTRSLNYGPIHFLDDQRFIRIVQDELPAHQLDLRNAFTLKKMVLEYVDLESNTIKEIVLDNNKVNYFWSFTLEGDLYMTAFVEEETKLRFLKVSIT